ncbi:MAG: YtxH domain-containing protein [Chloroflexota bacterium]
MCKHLPFLFGFVMGAVVGWVVGTLYAPSAGQETRHQIGSRAIELGGRAERTAKDMAQQVRRQIQARHELDLQGEGGPGA